MTLIPIQLYVRSFVCCCIVYTFVVVVVVVLICYTSIYYSCICLQYKSDSIEKMRQAIRDKTKEMGLEKSVLSKQVIQQASARAMRGESPNLNNNNNALDLTKIRGNIPDNMPTVLYDPEDEMSSQEQIEVDPVGQTSLLNQFQNELSNAKWPTAGAVVREVGIMILVVAATAALIILWDAFLRDFYTNELHLIPTKEEINTRFEGLELYVV